MEIDDRSFRKALGCFASGVTVVSGRDEQGAPVGVTVSAFSSVSLNPPLVLFCLDKRNKSLEAFRDAPFAINVLREDQRQVSIQFASKGDDKWKGIEHTINADGVPLVDNSLAHLECVPHQVVDGGDHLIVIGRVVRLNQQTGGQPLVYFRGAYANLGESC
jgi:flavin reductase (DIM6/NTAB) family NADH-FMN oxidoreductase RutF